MSDFQALQDAIKRVIAADERVTVLTDARARIAAGADAHLTFDDGTQPIKVGRAIALGVIDNELARIQGGINASRIKLAAAEVELKKGG